MNNPHRRRNQTEDHELLADAASTWLMNKGQMLFYEREIGIAPGYIPDGVAVCYVWLSYMRRLFRDQITYQDAAEIKKTEGWNHLFVFESKVSRPDFLRTFRSASSNRYKPVAQGHFVIALKGVAKVHEVMDPWGLIERRGHGLTVVKKAKFCRMGKPAVDAMIAKVFWRLKGFRERTTLHVPYCPDCQKKLKQDRIKVTK